MSSFIPGLIPQIPVDPVELSKEEIERSKRHACIEKTFRKTIEEVGAKNTYLERISKAAGFKMNVRLLSFEEEICTPNEKGELEITNFRVLKEAGGKGKSKVKAAKYTAGAAAVILSGGVLLLAHGAQKAIYRVEKAMLARKEKKQKAAISETRSQRPESTNTETSKTSSSSQSSDVR